MASRKATLEYLTTTKIGEKRQLTVPKQFREDLGLAAGAPLAVLRLGDGLVLVPKQQSFEHLCEQVGSALAGAGLTPEAILATLPEARKHENETRRLSKWSLTPAESAQLLRSKPIVRNRHLCAGWRTFVLLCLL